MSPDKYQADFIEKLYIEMYYALLIYAQSALNDPQLAEEAVQDAFRIACGKADDLLSSPNPQGWITNTLKYVIKNMIRSRARLNNMIVSSMALDENSVSTNPDTLDTDVLYSDLIDNEDYQLIKKIALEKYTMLAASKELGISVEACKKRVQRAKKNLKKYIDNKK